MNLFDQKKWPYRLLLLSLAIIFIYITLVQITGRQSDENSFTSLNKFLYITNNLEVVTKNNNPDSLNSYDCILEIEQKSINSPEIFSYVQNIKKDVLLLTVLNLPSNKVSYYKISKNKLTPDNFMFFNNCIYITDVKENGASHIAGIKKGDLILKVNNKKISDPYLVDNLIRNNPSGQPIKYDILRNGVIKSYYVELAKISIELYFVIYIITGILFFIISLFIGLNRPKLKSARLTSIAFAIFSFVLVVSFSRATAPSNLMAYITTFFLYILTYLWLPLSIQSIIYLTNFENYRKYRWLIRLPYIISLFSLISIIASVLFRVNALFINELFKLILILYLVGIILYFYKISNITTRKIIKYPYISWVIFTCSFVVIIVFNNFLTIPKENLKNYLFINYILTTSCIIPLSYLYTISRNGLFKLRLKMRRNIIYILISFSYKLILFLGLAYFIHIILNLTWNFPSIRISYTTVEYLDRPLRGALQLYYSKLISILITLFAVYIYIRIIKLSQKILDDVFYRSHIDFRELSSQMHQIQQKDIDANKLADNFIRSLSQGLKVKHGGILFIGENNKFVVQKYYGFKDYSDLKEFTTLVANDLICESVKHIEPFPVSVLDGNIKSVFEEYQIEYIVPVISKNKYHALILIGEKLSESAFVLEELSFMKDIADHSAVVIENSILYQKTLKQERLNHELELARQIQYNSLPQSSPEIESFDIYGISAPAYEVGGDFYDYFAQDKYLDVIIGDVAGKGTSAAMYMSNAIGIIRTLQKFSLNPKQVLANLNELMSCNLNKNSFITALCARFDIQNKSISLSRAGHLPLYYFNSKTHNIEKITPKGIAIGVVDNHSFIYITEEISLNYNTGDTFLFITDGIIEARGKENEELGEGIIFKHLKNNTLNSNQLVQNIIVEINRETPDNTQFDDITAIAIKIK